MSPGGTGEDKSNMWIDEICHRVPDALRGMVEFPAEFILRVATGGS